MCNFKPAWPIIRFHLDKINYLAFSGTDGELDYFVKTFFGGWEERFILAIRAFCFLWIKWRSELGEGKGERGRLNFLFHLCEFLLIEFVVVR